MAFSSVIIAAAHLGRLTLNDNLDDSLDDSDRSITNSHSSRLHHSMRVRATEGRVLVNELSITGQARRSRPQTSTARNMQWTNDREQPPYSQYYDHPAPYRTPNYVEPPLSRPGSGKTASTMKRFTATSGIGIIINITRFARSYKERAGTETDAKALWDMFKYLGVTPYLYNDWSRDDILNLLECIAKKNYDVHCLMIAILSHGGDGYVLASDGKEVFVKDMVDIFSATNCPCFRGKPKVFIIQACRVPDKQEGVLYGLPNGVCDDETDHCSVSNVEQTIPDRFGFLYAFSIIPGCVPCTGSVFISHLAKAVRENAHQQHLSEIFTEASGRVKKQFPRPKVIDNLGMMFYIKPQDA